MMETKNAKKLAARKYWTTPLSHFTFKKEDSKAFTGEFVADAWDGRIERCLEEDVPEYSFYFYYWLVEPSYDSCVDLLKRMQVDGDTEPKIIKVFENPDYM